MLVCACAQIETDQEVEQRHPHGGSGGGALEHIHLLHAPGQTFGCHETLGAFVMSSTQLVQRLLLLYLYRQNAKEGISSVRGTRRVQVRTIVRAYSDIQYTQYDTAAVLQYTA